MNNLVGQPAPTLTLPDQDDRPFDLSTLVGHGPLCLFFFPKAGSFGCARESCSFRAALETEHFKGMDVKVVGVTPSPIADIKKMVRDNKLGYPVLCDLEGHAARAYHVEKGLLGMTPGRVTFIIDRSGHVVSYKTGVLNFAGHTTFAKEEIKKLA